MSDTEAQVVGSELSMPRTHEVAVNTGTREHKVESRSGTAAVTHKLAVDTSDTAARVVESELSMSRTHVAVNTGTREHKIESRLGTAAVTHGVAVNTSDTEAQVEESELSMPRTHEVAGNTGTRELIVESRSGTAAVTHELAVSTSDMEAQVVESELSMPRTHDVAVNIGTREHKVESRLGTAAVTHKLAVDTSDTEAQVVGSELGMPRTHEVTVNTCTTEHMVGSRSDTTRTCLEELNADTEAMLLKRRLDAAVTQKEAMNTSTKLQVVRRELDTYAVEVDTYDESHVVDSGLSIPRAQDMTVNTDTREQVVEDRINTTRTPIDAVNTDTKTRVLHGSRRVVYVWSPEMVKTCDLLPRVPGRASRVHGLIEAYGLLPYMTVLPPVDCGKDHLSSFHSQEYVDFLEFINDEEDSEKNMESKEEFGISCDCPSVPGVFNITKMVAGSTLRGVEALMSGECQAAINWTGGWHHGRRDEAAGFCYVNDVVIALLKLTERYKRILYVDIDLHHGDAVQDAFAYTSTIMTVSFHKFSPGFYPGTGSLGEVGHGRGRYYNVNVPLEDGITDAFYSTVFKRVMDEVYRTYLPSVVVMQCGADTLVGDSMNCFNLTLDGVGDCVNHILKFGLSTLLLGGGGYNTPNTARCWAHLTAVALGGRLDLEIPDHEFFLEYGPDYQLDVTPSNRVNMNTREELARVVQTVVDNLQKIFPATDNRSRQTSAQYPNASFMGCHRSSSLSVVDMGR